MTSDDAGKRAPSTATRTSTQRIYGCGLGLQQSGAAETTQNAQRGVALATQDRDEREVISAKISREAAQGWRKFCDLNGVSVTAMLEVAGLQLKDETAPPTIAARRNMVEQARELDTDRRRRRRS